MAEIHLRPTTSGGGAYTATGSPASPVLISASGLTPIGSQREVKFVKGNGGPVTVTANPQISAGTIIGQELTLRGTSDTDTISLDDANGLLMNGPCILRNGSSLAMLWDGTVWIEVGRNDR